MVRNNCVVDYLESKIRDQEPTSSAERQNSASEVEPFTALSWGHDDQRLFVACSKTLHVLRVYKQIPTLSLLSQIHIKTMLTSDTGIGKFCLPEPLKDQLRYCFASTIKVGIF
jgi:hypothetical protein